ncbi:hypothetical protein B296_00038450 [Ensete ventricosum]|uniref:Uncharacterized protein n=1 Tax=Ensete ventricosum TaxID=4639 RepID=A0A426Z8Z7_ENSVE|nr:hypothetical protein B296_00038450 [Ensete ventricosum]
MWPVRPPIACVTSIAHDYGRRLMRLPPCAAVLDATAAYARPTQRLPGPSTASPTLLILHRVAGSGTTQYGWWYR